MVVRWKHDSELYEHRIKLNNLLQQVHNVLVEMEEIYEYHGKTNEEIAELTKQELKRSAKLAIEGGM